MIDFTPVTACDSCRHAVADDAQFCSPECAAEYAYLLEARGTGACDGCISTERLSECRKDQPESPSYLDSECSIWEQERREWFSSAEYHNERARGY